MESSTLSAGGPSPATPMVDTSAHLEVSTRPDAVEPTTPEGRSASGDVREPRVVCPALGFGAVLPVEHGPYTLHLNHRQGEAVFRDATQADRIGVWVDGGEGHLISNRAAMDVSWALAHALLVDGNVSNVPTSQDRAVLDVLDPARGPYTLHPDIVFWEVGVRDASGAERLRVTVNGLTVGGFGTRFCKATRLSNAAAVGLALTLLAPYGVEMSS